MNSRATSSISSFVIRFVVNDANGDDKPSVYRGSIRHIQSDEELNFSTWKEAVEFIRRFVPLEESNNDEMQV